MLETKHGLQNNLHIVERPTHPVRVSEIEKKRVNLNLGHIAGTGEFPKDVVYEGLERSAYEATHDSLTGLLNRRGLDQVYSRVLGEKNREGGKLDRAIIVFDIDGFKKLNDTQGHQAGDALLARLAESWARSLKFRQDDVVARLGGDEFVLLVDTSEKGNANRHLRDQEEVIAGTRRHVEEEALVVGSELGLSFDGISSGAAVCSPDKSLEQVLAEADKAMYADKLARKASR